MNVRRHCAHTELEDFNEGRVRGFRDLMRDAIVKGKKVNSRCNDGLS